MHTPCFTSPGVDSLAGMGVYVFSHLIVLQLPADNAVSHHFSGICSFCSTPWCFHGFYGQNKLTILSVLHPVEKENSRYRAKNFKLSVLRSAHVLVMATSQICENRACSAIAEAVCKSGVQTGCWEQEKPLSLGVRLSHS